MSKFTEAVKNRWTKIRIFCGVHFVTLTLSLGFAVILAALGLGSYAYWLYRQPKFHDLTVELGTESIRIDAFLTEYASPRHVSFVSDVTTVDLGKVGATELTLKNWRQEQTVTLTVQDTTPPQVTFLEKRTEHTDYVPDPKDFVEQVTDLSETRVMFEKPVTIPGNYADQTFTVVVKDASGNEVRQDCTLELEWMKDSYQLELGTPLTAEELLYCPEKDLELIAPEELEAINEGGVGEYTVTSATAAKTMTCAVTVADTTGPVLEVQDLSTYVGRAVPVEKFVVSATDFSGDVELILLTDPNWYEEGQHDVEIKATDIWGNTTVVTANVAVSRDLIPPSIGGIGTALSVAKHSTPDYLSGVYAIDAVDGSCEVTVDASGVNVDAAGTYYAVYHAKDKSNNMATAKRKVVVAHDAEDTRALADRIAAGLGSDPEALRDYVRSNIGYNHNWGGDDPVWYGFTTWGGNCYVHALCLRELLTRKGYTTQLIWTTNKTHYWLLINLNGTWRHIDPTPSSLHSRYSLMTDDQRVSTLSGRDWDRSAWPACE